MQVFVLEQSRARGASMTSRLRRHHERHYAALEVQCTADSCCFTLKLSTQLRVADEHYLSVSVQPAAVPCCGVFKDFEHKSDKGTAGRRDCFSKATWRRADCGISVELRCILSDMWPSLLIDHKHSWTPVLSNTVTAHTTHTHSVFDIFKDKM